MWTFDQLSIDHLRKILLAKFLVARLLLVRRFRITFDELITNAVRNSRGYACEFFQRNDLSLITDRTIWRP